MIKVLSTASDQVVAQRIEKDLRQAGYALGSGVPARGDVVILVLSPAALEDPALNAAMLSALDLSLHIVPVLAQPVRLPKLIDHLTVVNFTDGSDLALLRSQIDLDLSADAPRPVRVLTPTVRRSNRSVGIVVAAAALFMFAAGLYGVGVLHIQAPVEEFNAEDTMVALTIEKVAAPALQAYAQLLPQTTEDATNYPATLRAVPTVYRPLVALTATAVAAQGNR